jgi:hypothetical protein
MMWEWRLSGRSAPALLNPGQQPCLGLLAGQADQVNVDLGAQQPWQLAGLETDQQQAIAPIFVMQERGGPLIPAVRRCQVRRRDQRQGPVGPLQGVLHAVHEVVAWFEVPCLDDHRVAGLFELPGDPLRRGPVGAGVADEEVCRLGHPPPSTYNPLWGP